MAYNPTIWINDDGTGTVGTPVIADYMNNIEQGITNNDKQINDLNTNKLNILDLSKTFLSTPIVKLNQSLNQVFDYGCYEMVNVTDGFPTGYVSGDTDLILVVFGVDPSLEWQNFIMFDVRSNKIFKRNKKAGTLFEWREI